MIGKIALVLLVVAAVSGNPGADPNRRFIHRRLTVSPNFKALPFQEVVKAALPPKPRMSGSARVAGCGTAPLAPLDTAIDPAIVGGVEATPHEFPWQVALYIDNLYFCGGSLISDTWVLTAAHCMLDAGFVDVVLGAHDQSIAEPTQLTLRSTSYIVHESYSSALIHNDVAVIQLPQSVTYNDYIQPVCLATAPDLADGTIVTASGWGKDHDGIGGVTNTLNKVDIPTAPLQTCIDYYGDLVVNEDMICVDTTGGHGTCNGDSGGPLNYKTGGITETRGITSFGSTAGCESGAPGSFTNVLHFTDWILTNTGVSR